MSISSNQLKSTSVYGVFRQYGYTGMNGNNGMGTTGGVYIQNNMTVDGNIYYKGGYLSVLKKGTYWADYTYWNNITNDWEIGSSNVIKGRYAGETGQGIYSTAIGFSAGRTNQSSGSIAIGLSSGSLRQGGNAVAIGGYAGFISQGGNSMAIGSFAGSLIQGENSIAIGRYSGFESQESGTIAIGGYSGYRTQGSGSIAIGGYSGFESQKSGTIAIGGYSGYKTQGSGSIAIGGYSGFDLQGGNSIAIGSFAGYFSQGGNALAIGSNAGQSNQGGFALAIGSSAGSISQGINAVAIGFYAGQTNQPANSIILNASGNGLSPTTSNALYINPIRGATYSNILYYDTVSKEVGYGGYGAISAAGIISTPLSITAGGVVFGLRFESPSDRRLKGNILSIGTMLDKINQLEPVEYEWKNTGYKDFGFIAQDYYKVFPDLKPKELHGEEPTDKEGNPKYYSIDYGKITCFLTQAIKELTNKPTEYKYYSCFNGKTRVSNKDHIVIFDTFHDDRHHKLDEIIYDIKTGFFTNRSATTLCLNVSYGFPRNNESIEQDHIKTWFCHSKTGNTVVGHSTIMYLLSGESFHCCFRHESRHTLVIDQPENAYIQICRL